ncbi:CRISPR-associated endonuclease Cas2 [Rhizobium sp. CECT 9324]|uniref:CRISPR-associated endonuclease Cas2 n=1 Tax=Rhizobium sp. CECT 9324 TaxID=2845820 RepID=UPI001E282C8D|nr:CRISPR-associated endonuclease Cas2 [Rhizobium sp. CECT 9324]CAH0343040.1 CRISPR-associated endoribonuclease Cas2 [Rhizobium sp. CECT 9324]
MPRARMFTVFAYDISDDRKRRRVATILEDSAVRVQNSVFEAWLSARQTEALKRRIEVLLVAGDNLRIYVLAQSGLSRSSAFGGPALGSTQTFLLI